MLVTGQVVTVVYVVYVTVAGRAGAELYRQPNSMQHRAPCIYLDWYSDVVVLDEYHLRSTRLAAAKLARAKIASGNLTIMAAIN